MESNCISDHPRKLSFKKLDEITNNFSQERLLGNGTFGKVFKGVLDGEEIAVKLIPSMPGIGDQQFQNEFKILKRLKHKNIVRFVGFCEENEEMVGPYQGKLVLCEIMHRALCLEYVPGGSLGKHLSGECLGNSWIVRYKIIKGICEGLKYLHQEAEVPILHFDLKPDNILLDVNMEPKIADFGLSRLIGEENTIRTQSSLGTLGYLPPEFINNQIISKEFDIYSLGVIITKIITGNTGYSSSGDMEAPEFIEHVHNNWSKILHEMPSYAELEADCKQVKRCIEIAVSCMDKDRRKRPPTNDIVRRLDEIEHEKAEPESLIEKSNIPGRALLQHMDRPVLQREPILFTQAASCGPDGHTHCKNCSPHLRKDLAITKCSYQCLRCHHKGLRPKGELKMGNGLLDKNMKLKSRLERLIDIEPPQNIKFSFIDDIHLIEIQDRVRGRTSMKFDIYGQGLTIVNLFRRGIDRGRISTNFDMYGQGLTVMKIAIEPHGFYGHREMCSKISIELVLGNWRKRLQATTKDTSPEEYCQQMKKCIETALKPVEHDRHQWPRIIRDTIHMLNKTDNLIFFSLRKAETGALMHEIEDTNLLEVHPKKLRFPFVPKKCVSCSLLLNNRTDNRMAFRLIGKNKRKFVPTLPLYGVVPPSCTYILALTVRNQLQKPATDSEEALTLQSIRLTHDQDLQLKNFDQDTVAKEYEILFNKSEEETCNNVRQVTLKTVCDPGVEHASSKTEPEIKIIPIPNAQQVSSIEVHPTEPWIMTTHHAGNLRVWNYETMAALNSFEVTDEAVYAAKFITREKWIVAGDANGCIHVYSYDEGQDIVSFEAHDGRIVSLAVHPTGTYVLSSSHDDHLVKLWHWDRDCDLEKGWVCTRTFEGQSGWVCTRTFEERSNKVSQLISNSEDTGGFVSVSRDCTIKVWSLHSDVSNAITLLENLDDLLCVDYITGDDRQHLITGSKDGTAQIWDMERKRCIQKLEGHTHHLSGVYCHPELPIVFTGSLDGTVRVWDSTAYRLEKIIGFNLGAVYAFGYIKSLRRIVVGCHQGIATMEITFSLEGQDKFI